MNSADIRKKFLEFFEKRGHTIVPSSSLIPDDPSVLLTTAGMQQFKPYFVGKADPMKDFGSKNTVSIQKSFRTSDIDEVGNETHNTFFEMLGHFSFGDYFKKETIEWEYEFLTNVLNISPDRISATVFAGDEGIPFDKESYDTWLKLLPADRIRRGSREDNVWGPAGSEGPCGAANEVYVDDVEIGTLVFMEYYSAQDKSLTLLPKRGVDVGLGLERLAMKVQNIPTIFETDLFAPLMEEIPAEDKKIRRIIADHLRASVHLIADGVEPSNKDRGYILRRLLRRAIFHAINVASAQAQIPLNSRTPESWNERTYAVIHRVAEKAIGLSFFGIAPKANFVITTIDREMGKFLDLLKSNSELHKVVKGYLTSGKKVITGENTFKLFSTFGLPIDYIKDEAQKSGLEVDLAAFEVEREKHQEISRAGQEKKFGGHGLLLDTGELKAKDETELKKVTRLHTATHMLQQALRDVLGPEVKQMGSDITVERTRFDFTFPRKLTPDEIKKVEEIVNQKIKEDLPMQKQVFPKAEAEKTGALYFFKEKYPDPVNVYFIGKTLETAWSKEFCGGPHVGHTGEVGSFKIIKEEAVGAGTRRIRGTVEP